MAGQVIWFIKFLIVFEILSTVIAAFGNSNENINSTNHFLEFVNQCNDMANKVLYNKNGNSSVIQCCTAKLRTLCIKTNCSQPMYGSWCGPEQLSKFINKSLLVNCQNNSWTLEYCQDLPNHWKGVALYIIAVVVIILLIILIVVLINNCRSKDKDYYGVSGVSGVSGASAVTGTSDVSGVSGTSAVTGTSGISGVSGTSAVTDVSGVSSSNVSSVSGISGAESSKVSKVSSVVKEPIEKDAPIPKIAKTEAKTKPIEPIPKITKVDKVKNYGKGSNPTLSTIRRAVI